ncbi:MAG TPA: polyprenol monophosphomannose synthase, partial [Actinomycetota bacterium]|nr:polyprenol monophosphomannose synthase [Actinomycetota bacterium]
RDNVREALERLRAADAGLRIIVVDDASPDGTADVVLEAMARDGGVALVERPPKGGLASAYLDGFRRALDQAADVVVEMDADLSHRPEDLGGLLDGIRRHHVVIGSRYIPGGDVRNWSAFRRALSRGGNWYARLLLGFPVRDATSGYRVFRAEALRELISDPIRSDGYGFQIELAYRAWRRGFSVGEVPITFVERRAGQSKLSRRIVVEALWQVMVWGVRDRVLRRPYR